MAAVPSILTALINQLTLDLEDDVLLVLDDYHLVSDVNDITRWVEQLIETTRLVCMWRSPAAAYPSLQHLSAGA